MLRLNIYLRDKIIDKIVTTMSKLKYWEILRVGKTDKLPNDFNSMNSPTLLLHVLHCHNIITL